MNGKRSGETRVKVKICGLTRPEDIAAVNAARPDYIGFVFAESRRRVSLEQAAALSAGLAPGILTVGVFVDEDIDKILAAVESAGLGLIQLHGSEGEEYVARVKALSGKPVIKAVSVSSKGDAAKWAGGAADYLLLDSVGGGTGRRFDWGLIGEPGKPFFLAGGLDPGNVREAIERVRPFAVDVSGGVETRGAKDAGRIKQFVEAARAAARCW